MGSLIKDEKMLLDFISWLPPIREDEAYLIVMMIRSTGLRDIYGFKGSDHKLASKLIHGYLSEVVTKVPFLPLRNVEHWRLRLYEEITRFAVSAVQSRWYYVKYKAGTREVDEVFLVPPQLIAIYISINPTRILRASLSTVKDVEEAVWTIAEGRATVKSVFARPDERYHANAMKHTRTRFHVIDVDDKELAERVLEVVTEALGFTPPRIVTRRGMHILLNLEELEEHGIIDKWVGRADKRMINLSKKYENLVRHGKDAKELRAMLEEYVWYSDDPLFHRFQVASKLYVSEKGAGLIEIKKKPLEPVPGTLYKGVVVKFYH